MQEQRSVNRPSKSRAFRQAENTPNISYCIGAKDTSVTAATNSCARGSIVLWYYINSHSLRPVRPFGKGKCTGTIVLA